VRISCPPDAGKAELGQHAVSLAAALSVECTGQAEAANATLEQHTGWFSIDLNNFKHSQRILIF